MKKDLQKAVDMMKNGEFTCVLVKEERFYTSKERGVRPLLYFLETGLEDGFSSADKVVGKGAAFLYLLLKVDCVYAEVLSKEAKAVFDENNLSYFYGKLVDRIQNRDKTGLCPIEDCVINAKSKEEAYELIKKRLAKLKGE